MKRRYDNEISDMMRDMSHRERRLEARAAHYEQRYIEAINESFALEQIVARELEFRRMGEKTILDLENSMQSNHSIEEGHIKEVKDEIRNKYERNERERERRFKQELELQKSVHNQALENAKREYEKKLSKIQIDRATERNDLRKDMQHMRVRVAREMKRQSTTLRDFLKSNLLSRRSESTNNNKEKSNNNNNNAKLHREIQDLRTMISTLSPSSSSSLYPISDKNKKSMVWYERKIKALESESRTQQSEFESRLNRLGENMSRHEKDALKKSHERDEKTYRHKLEDLSAHFEIEKRNIERKARDKSRIAMFALMARRKRAVEEERTLCLERHEADVRKLCEMFEKERGDIEHSVRSQETDTHRHEIEDSKQKSKHEISELRVKMRSKEDAIVRRLFDREARALEHVHVHDMDVHEEHMDKLEHEIQVQKEMLEANVREKEDEILEAMYEHERGEIIENLLKNTQSELHHQQQQQNDNRDQYYYDGKK